MNSSEGRYLDFSIWIDGLGTSSELTEEQETLLDNRFQEPDTEYMASEKSIDLLKQKYGC